MTSSPKAAGSACTPARCTPSSIWLDPDSSPTTWAKLCGGGAHGRCALSLLSLTPRLAGSSSLGKDLVCKHQPRSYLYSISHLQVILSSLRSRPTEATFPPPTL